MCRQLVCKRDLIIRHYGSSCVIIAGLSLVIKRFLPPITPPVGRRVHLLADSRDVQSLDRRIVPIHLEVWDTGLVSVRGSRHGELSDVLLQSDGDGFVADA